MVLLLLSHQLIFDFYRDVYLDIWGSKGRVEIFQEGLFIRYSKIKKHRAISNTKEISIDKGTIKTHNAVYRISIFMMIYIDL